MKHLFDTNIAKLCGIEEAIILENIYFWCKKNEANDKLTNGKPWTYNSVKAFNELFDYMSPSKISRALKNLEALGFIEIGEFNSNSYNHTKWYCITDKTRNVFGEENENSIFHFENSNTCFENSNNQNSKITITDINTNKKQDNKHSASQSKPPKFDTPKITKAEENNLFLSSLPEEERDLSEKCADLMIDYLKPITKTYNPAVHKKTWQVDFVKRAKKLNISLSDVLLCVQYVHDDTSNFEQPNNRSPEKLFEKFDYLYGKAISKKQAYKKSGYTQKKQEETIARVNQDTNKNYAIF
jgi:DNA-binding PadR family transcriptional regulator